MSARRFSKNCNTPCNAALLAFQVGDVLVFNLMSVFGARRSSHVYDACGQASNLAHNHGCAIRESETYADDGLLINRLTALAASRLRYLRHIEGCFGPTGHAEEKDTWCSCEQLQKNSPV